MAAIKCNSIITTIFIKCYKACSTPKAPCPTLTPTGTVLSLPPHGYKAEAEVPCFKFMTKYLELQLTGSWLPPFSRPWTWGEGACGEGKPFVMPQLHSQTIKWIFPDYPRHSCVNPALPSPWHHGAHNHGSTSSRSAMHSILLEQESRQDAQKSRLF